jgi:rhodanese-related sulfurtransferase
LKTISEITILLVASIGLSLITNLVSPFGIPLIGQWETSKGIVRADKDNPYDESVFEIDSVSAAKKIYDLGKALFVDARSVASYTEGHVKGAISFPIGEFDIQIDDFLNRFTVDQPMVTYCSGRTCEDSHRLAQMLVEFGYKNVSVMLDGFPGWKAKGYPIE